eukprot:TRINITY_DN2482_c0_g2_i1.p1 TRINITY_DN2482_c0_g2~~TRINITY_DN2482_c0_g2_i1.p1  ORF type:complete len:126 (-),score=20.80 TRINITY_DN2482_c0_g2_i1:254-631(-)
MHLPLVSNIHHLQSLGHQIGSLTLKFLRVQILERHFGVSKLGAILHGFQKLQSLHWRHHDRLLSMPSGEESIKGLIVEPSGSGKGLPYAPENWPQEGDKWGWQVRKRISKSGFFTDRFLFPPDCL